MVDFWQGLRDGQRIYQDSFNSMMDRDRQMKQDAINNELLRQKMEMGQMELENARYNQETKRGLGALEQKLAATKPVTTYERSLAATVPTEPTAVDKLGLGAYAVGQQPTAPDLMPKEESPLVKSTTDVPQYSDREKAKERQSFLMGRGAFDMLEKYGKVQDLTDKLDERQLKDMTGLLQLAKQGPAGKQLAVNMAAMRGADAKTQAIIQGATFDPNFVKLQTEDGDLYIVEDAKGNTHIAKMQPRVEKEKVTWSEPYEQTVGGKKALVQKSSDGQVKPVLQDVSTTQRININMPGTDDIDVLARKVANGEEVMANIPKRIYAQVANKAEQINPNFSIRNANADYSLARNPGFRNRAITAEALPEVLTSMVNAGKKLNYPDAKFAGVVKQWTMGQLNDPDLAAYMALRNDGLMELASVMRSNGMTDMAHRAEVEASSPTMSPKALDAWYNAQMKALEPRLKRFNRVIGGNEPKLPGNLQPVTSLQSVPAATVSKVTAKLQSAPPPKDGVTETFAQMEGRRYPVKWNGSRWILNVR